MLRAARALHKRRGDRGGRGAAPRQTTAGRIGDRRRLGRCGRGAAAADVIVAARSGASRTQVAPTLGSDVPACLLSLAARGEGAGDELSRSTSRRSLGTPVLLVNPRVALSTADVFAAWNGIDQGPLGDWREGRNDLEAAGDRARSADRDRCSPGCRRSRAPTSSACRDRARPASPCSTATRRATRATEAVPREWWHLATFLR